jgi:hypothetical protein
LLLDLRESPLAGDYVGLIDVARDRDRGFGPNALDDGPKRLLPTHTQMVDADSRQVLFVYRVSDIHSLSSF